MRRLHPFRVVAAVDHLGQDGAKARADARKRASPLLREWERRVGHHVTAGYLLPIDAMVAKELLNYPSANHGKSFPGRRRLAEITGVNIRTISRALDRLEECGLLKTRRGGPGDTATRFFCCNGLYVFGGKAFMPLSLSSLDGARESSLDRTPVSPKPSESFKPTELEPPPTPGERVGESRCNSEQLLDPFGQSGQVEIIGPVLRFDEFWQASNKLGAEGYALASFNKLTPDDLHELTARVRSDRCDWSRNVYVGAWLKERMWLSEREPEKFFASPLKHYVHVEPLSPEWRVERERQAAAGNSARVQFMDQRAIDNKGVTIELIV